MGSTAQSVRRVCDVYAGQRYANFVHLFAFKPLKMGQKVVFFGGYHSGASLWPCNGVIVGQCSVHSTEARGHQRDICAVCIWDDVFRILLIFCT